MALRLSGIDVGTTARRLYAPAVDATTLARRTLDLVDIPSVSRDEDAVAEHVAAAMGEAPVELVHRGDDGRTLLYLTGRRPGRDLVLLAGHLDTVPPQANLPGRIENGAVHGLGASDMKGGVAVMVELARSLGDDPAVDIGFLFFPREELPPEESALPAVFAGAPVVLEAGLVVVLEPTDNTIQAGCVGNLNAELAFAGVSAHSARPWLGVNAVDRAVEGLARILPVPSLDVDVQGLRFVEVVSVTEIHGGIASNVIPSRVACTLNYRYAPDRAPADAETRIAELAAAAGGELRILSNSPPARVAADAPLVHRLAEAGGFAVEPKQAWTPVAEFAAQGLDAVNLGPGATRYAHTQDEQVEIAELVRTFEALRRLIAGGR
jgi:succinyl-diaminopimelate desuccinylase